MEKSKENHGITLVALVVLIIVMAILITTAIYSGVGSVRYTRFMRIKSEMEIMQVNVNSWYEKYVNGDESVLNYGEEVNYSDYDKEFVYVGADEEASQNYKYFTAQYIKDTLEIDGIEYDYLISIKDRMIILVDGLIYQGKRYYIPDDFDLQNTEVNEPISSVDFNLVCGRNPKDLKQEVVFIYDIKFYDNGREINISKFNVEYSTDGSNWTSVSSTNSKTEYNGNNAYMINTKDDGTYIVRIKDRSGKIITRTDNLEKSIEVVNCSFPSFNNNDWQIYSPRQLRFLAEYVNNAYTTVGNEKLTNVLANSGHVEAEIKELTENTWIYLMNDLDLGARPGPGDTDEDRWETEANEKVKWEPIGSVSTNILTASFDGQNHTIKGVYVNREENFNGIFGVSYSVQNLKVKDGYIKGGQRTGGIVGNLKNGRIENCINEGNTVILREGSNKYAGGIVGNSYSGNTNKTKITNCINKAKIIAKGKDDMNRSTTGGIVGTSGICEIMNCYNYGNVTSEGKNDGGIAGAINLESTVKNCINYAKIEGIGCVGGIVGNSSTSSKVEKCENKGKIEGDTETSGIVGVVGTETSVEDCINYENIKGNIRTAGIGGTLGQEAAIKKSVNLGKIEGHDLVGGIAGVISKSNTNNESTGNIESCYNKGIIIGETQVGGIVAVIGGSDGGAKVTECYNKGNISGTEKVGSVIGYQTNTSGGNILNNLYYLSTLALGAINGVDDAANNIRSTTDDFPDLESFLSALNSGTIN